ncbi:MAG: methyl-accepting chemotaxis protein [Syntrophomonas sp.]
MANKINKDIFERSTPDSQSKPPEINEERKPGKNETVIGDKKGISGAVFNEVNILRNAIKTGKLDARANLKGLDEAGQELLGSINEILDTVTGPLNLIGEFIVEVKNGSHLQVITDDYQGDFSIIKNNINECIDVLHSLLGETNRLTQAAIKGELDVRGNADQFKGGWNEVITGINETLDAVIGPLNIAAEYVERISKGDIPEKITDSYYGDFNEIKNNLNACIDGLGGLVESSTVLANMAVNNYTKKVEGQYQGIYAKTAASVNSVREKVLDIQNAVTNISIGDLSDLEYFRTMGKRCEEDHLMPAFIAMMDNIQALVEDAAMLSQGAVKGQLDIRGDAGKHGGVFGQVIEGVNATLDAIIGPLNIAAEYVDRISKGDIPGKITSESYGDFNEIKNNLNTCIDAINMLVTDANLLAQAAVEGNLDYRADAGKHGGSFALIIEGVNATLDAVIEPIQEATEVLEEMEKGNLKVQVRGNYQGDHNLIKNALNSTLDTFMACIHEISTVLTEVANGNLNIAVTSDYRGDFTDIKDSLNMIIDSLNETLGGINLAAEQVSIASDQLAGSSQMLAQGAANQSSSIEELTASITQIAAQTNQNAAYAGQANELALNARDGAVEGNDRMKYMLDAMEAINESSGNISKIIKVIDEIAFQTNILALNAAVEAARAGQHGKGFAVVAEEVRNLAARSASAAKETTELIESSIKKTEAGTKIANDTANALEKIVDGVTKAAALVGDIAVASNEQATGIAQINIGVEQVSEVIQNNAATAEESAAASEELAGQANLLKEQVSRFILKKRESGLASGIQSLSPEMLEILEEMLRSNKFAQLFNQEKANHNDSCNNQSITKVKISLSDNEFGKY